MDGSRLQFIEIIFVRQVQFIGTVYIFLPCFLRVWFFCASYLMIMKQAPGPLKKKTGCINREQFCHDV